MSILAKAKINDSKCNLDSSTHKIWEENNAKIILEFKKWKIGE